MSAFSTVCGQVTAPVGEGQLAAHEGLVRWVVRQQWLGELRLADALHEGRIGLWQALRHYDAGCGTAFSSYAVPAISHAVWRAVAVQQRLAASRQPLVLRLAPSAAEPGELVYQGQVWAALEDLVSQLPARLQAIIVSHYGLAAQAPQTFAALGSRLGLSRQRVHQLHGEALLWLAHPAHCWALRLLLERHSRRDCLAALVRQRQFWRRRQRRRPGSQRAAGGGGAVRP